jgi:hypothetical protein
MAKHGWVNFLQFMTVGGMPDIMDQRGNEQGLALLDID